MGLGSKRKRVPGAQERYAAYMDEALRRVATARLQIAEATTIDELDIGKSNLQMAFAEVQRVVRLAKEEAGLELRPVQEVEERYRELLKRFSSPAGEGELE